MQRLLMATSTLLQNTTWSSTETSSRPLKTTSCFVSGTLWHLICVRAVIGKLSNYLPKVVESHHLIVNAIETGRGEEAGLLLRSHVEASLAYLTQNESNAGFLGEPPGTREMLHGHPALSRSACTYRGGLGPARLRKVTELVNAKIEEELRIDEMAELAGLSTAHFSQMFRRSTGESPHQFVLRQRVERAKEIGRAHV